MSYTVPPRPRTLTAEQAQRAAAATIDRMIGSGVILNADREQSISDLVRISCFAPRDGYQLAKALDTHHHWYCNSDTVEELDAFAGDWSSELDLAIRQWVTENDIRPSVPIGTRVETPHGTGILDEVYQHSPGTYAVRIDADENPNRRYIVAFELVRPAGGAVAVNGTETLKTDGQTVRRSDPSYSARRW